MHETQNNEGISYSSFHLFYPKNSLTLTREHQSDPREVVTQAEQHA